MCARDRIVQLLPAILMFYIYLGSLVGFFSRPNKRIYLFRTLLCFISFFQVIVQTLTLLIAWKLKKNDERPYKWVYVFQTFNCTVDQCLPLAQILLLRSSEVSTPCYSCRDYSYSISTLRSRKVGITVTISSNGRHCSRRDFVLHPRGLLSLYIVLIVPYDCRKFRLINLTICYQNTLDKTYS